MSTEASTHVDEDADQLGPLEELAARELTVGGFPAGVVEALAQPLDLTRVKKKPGSNHDYIGHADIRRTLNRIFGYGGWGYTTDSVNIVTQGPLEKDGKTGVQCCAIARVTLRLRLADGTWLEKGGTGEGTGNGYGPTAPVEAPGKAAKEAESDALKRAAINLGDQFGLILYAKEERKQLQAEAEYNAPAAEVDVTAVVVLAAGKGKGEATMSLLEAEKAEHGHVRVGKLAAIRARLEALPEAGEPAEKPAEPEAVATPEPEVPNRPTAQAASKPLPEGTEAASSFEVQACRSMAVKLGDAAIAWFDEQLKKHRGENEDAGYGAIVTKSWVNGATTFLSQKLAEAGVPEGDVTPAPAAEEATDAGVAEAFGVEQARQAA